MAQAPQIKDAEKDEYDDELTAALEAKKSGTQDTEGKTAEEIAAEDAAAEKAKEEAAKAAAEEDVTIKKSEYTTLQTQVADSRSLALSQKRQMATLETTIKRLERNQTKLVATPPVATGDEDEDLDDEGKKTPAKVELEGPGEEEKIQEGLKKISDERSGMFDLMLEQMVSMEAYKDVGEVCSDSHTQEIIHAVANEMSGDPKNGVDFGLAALRVEEHIWSQPNPYKYLYSLIKEYHPDYVDKTGTKTSAAGDEGKKGEEGKKKASAEAAKAPGSIAGFTGSQDSKTTGWTAERIDNLPEDELDSVPEDVYEKYMAGHLD